MASGSPGRTGPLSHVAVLDFCQYMSGPYCTQILADLGARVIKIEPPTGDPTRSLAPYFVRGTSAYFHSLNRNKESVAIDLKDERGRDLALRLVQRVELVVENFRVGVMDRLGLGYGVLKTLNPRLVMCSITGFGGDGPDSARPAYDAIVQAISGGMSVTGEPGGKPVRAGIPIADLAAGMFAAIGLLAGLAHRERTGEGQHIDLSMLDCQVSMLTYLASYCLVSGIVPGPQGSAHMSWPTYRMFTCADGVNVMVTASTEQMWRSLCSALDLAWLSEDPRYRTNADRLQHREDLLAILEPAFLHGSSVDVLARLAAADVPAAPVNTVERALSDPQVLHRDMVVELEHPSGERMRLVGNPIKGSAMQESSYRWPPDLGEHTDMVLSEVLHMTRDEIECLEANGVIKRANRDG